MYLFICMLSEDKINLRSFFKLIDNNAEHPTKKKVCLEIAQPVCTSIVCLVSWSDVHWCDSPFSP